MTADDRTSGCPAVKPSFHGTNGYRPIFFYNLVEMDLQL